MEQALSFSGWPFGQVASLKRHCDQIAEASPNDVQKVASILQKMIVDYYRNVRWQALLAFGVAFILEIIAVGFFLYAVAVAIPNGKMIQEAALSTISIGRFNSADDMYYLLPILSIGETICGLPHMPGANEQVLVGQCYSSTASRN